MTRDDIIRMAREAGATTSCINDEVWMLVLPETGFEQFASLVAAAEREKVAKWMIQRSYATGHGDTTEDLLAELDWQIKERIGIEREECAKVCDEKVDAEYATGKVDHNEMGWTQYCAMAIRLRERGAP